MRFEQSEFMHYESQCSLDKNVNFRSYSNTWWRTGEKRRTSVMAVLRVKHSWWQSAIYRRLGSVVTQFVAWNNEGLLIIIIKIKIINRELSAGGENFEESCQRVCHILRLTASKSTNQVVHLFFIRVHALLLALKRTSALFSSLYCKFRAATWRIFIA